MATVDDEKLPPPALATSKTSSGRVSVLWKTAALAVGVVYLLVSGPISDLLRRNVCYHKPHLVPPISNPHNRTVVLISVDGFR